jgi:hypothetical protein
MLWWLFALGAVLALGILFCIWFYADGDGHSDLPLGGVYLLVGYGTQHDYAAQAQPVVAIHAANKLSR